MQGSVVHAARWLGLCLVLASLIHSGAPFLMQDRQQATESVVEPKTLPEFRIDPEVHATLRVKLAEKEAEIHRLEAEVQSRNQQLQAVWRETELKLLRYAMIEFLDGKDLNAAKDAWDLEKYGPPPVNFLAEDDEGRELPMRPKLILRRDAIRTLSVDKSKSAVQGDRSWWIVDFCITCVIDRQKHVIEGEVNISGNAETPNFSGLRVRRIVSQSE